MGPGIGAVALVLLAVVVAVIFSLRKEEDRADAFARFAAGTELVVLPDGGEAREGLASLPGLPGPGRLLFGAVARSDDEIVGDVSVTRPAKEIRTDRRATFLALRRDGNGDASSRTRAAEAVEHVDSSSVGFGRILVADDGVWVVCRTTGKRVPGDRLREFRDYARGILADRLAGAR